MSLHAAGKCDKRQSVDKLRGLSMFLERCQFDKPFLLLAISFEFITHSALYEGWNFNSVNYLFTTDTK